jgi:hypothetical protein
VTTWTVVTAILLGIGLSASTGLNTFLPLLLFAAAARFGIAGIELSDKFQWLASDAAIAVLILACIIELIADKVPAVDHFLDSVGTVARPAAGAVAAAAAFTGTGMDPVVGAVLGLIIGAPISFGFHMLKAGTRVASTATTFGCANPVLSILEDLFSLFLSVVAIFAPILVPIAVFALALVLWRILKRTQAAPLTSPDSTP